MELEDAFAELGVPALSATPGRVREAFRARSLKAHPDHGGTAQAFTRLTQARERALAFAARKKIVRVRADGRVDYSVHSVCERCCADNSWCFCVSCDGTGRNADSACPSCSGSGGFHTRPQVQCDRCAQSDPVAHTERNRFDAPPEPGDIIDGHVVAYEHLGERIEFRACSRGVMVRWGVCLEDVLRGVRCDRLGVHTHGAFDPTLAIVLPATAARPAPLRVEFELTGVSDLPRLRRFQLALDKVVGQGCAPGAAFQKC